MRTNKLLIIFRGYLSDHNDGERFTIYITSYKKYKNWR